MQPEKLMGYRIFVLCLRQVFINWRTAARLSWFWLSLQFGLLFLIVLALPTAVSDGQKIESGAAWQFVVGMIAFWLVSLYGASTIAIGWHRFVLRDEEPDRFYVVRRDWPVFRYLGNVLKIGILLLLCSVPLMFGFAHLLGAVFNGVTSAQEVSVFAAFLVGIAVMFVLLTLLLWGLLRLGMLLPALAVGEKMTLLGSIRLTRPIAGQLFITAICVGLFQVVPSLLVQYLGVFGGSLGVLAWIATAIGLLAYWVSYFVGIGILTVTYGHLAENRPV